MLSYFSKLSLKNTSMLLKEKMMSCKFDRGPVVSKITVLN